MKFSTIKNKKRELELKGSPNGVKTLKWSLKSKIETPQHFLTRAKVLRWPSLPLFIYFFLKIYKRSCYFMTQNIHKVTFKYLGKKNRYNLIWAHLPFFLQFKQKWQKSTGRLQKSRRIFSYHWDRDGKYLGQRNIFTCMESR